MKKFKGLPVNVFRTNYDATNGGITNSTDKRERLILIGSEHCNIPEIFEGEPDEILVLQKKNVGGNDYLYTVPLKIDVNQSFMNGPMFGGNFIYTSDSRFPNKYPIPVHDRYEHSSNTISKQRTDDTNKIINNDDEIYVVFKQINGFAQPTNITYKIDLDYPPGSKFFQHLDKAEKFFNSLNSDKSNILEDKYLAFLSYLIKHDFDKHVLDYHKTGNNEISLDEAFHFQIGLFVTKFETFIDDKINLSDDVLTSDLFVTRVFKIFPNLEY